MKNAQFDTSQVKKVCETKIGIQFNTNGKEFNGWYFLDGKKTCRITVPKGRKNVPMGTYQSMGRQLKLTSSEFDQFLECSMTAATYKSLVQQRPQFP